MVIDMGRLIEPSALRKLVLYSEDRPLEIFNSTSLRLDEGVQSISIYQDRIVLGGYKIVAPKEFSYYDDHVAYVNSAIRFDDNSYSNLRKLIIDEAGTFYKRRETIDGFRRQQFRFFGQYLKKSERVYSLEDIIDLCIDAINMRGNNNE